MSDQGKFLPSATAISYSGDQVKVTWEMSAKGTLAVFPKTATDLSIAKRFGDISRPV